MANIGNTLKIEIEGYARYLARSGELIRSAEEGKLTPGHISRYVSGLLFLIRGTMGVIRRAEQRARDKCEWALAAHYCNKLREENGHDRWAESDLTQLPQVVQYGGHPDETALGRLLSYLDDTTARDPHLLLPYMLLAEYLTVLAGPHWLQMLEVNCRVPRSKLTVVANHVTLDQEHVVEGIQTIDALVDSPEKMEPMLEVLRRSFSYFEQFLDEILSTATQAA